MHLRHSPHVLGRRPSAFVRHARRVRRGHVALAACVAAIAVVLGLAWRADDGGDATAPTTSPPRTVIRGALGLAVPTGWRRAREVPRIPGMRFADPVAVVHPGSGVRMVAGFTTARSQTLLAPGLLRAIGTTLPPPERVRMESGLQGLQYTGLSLRGRGSLLDIYVAPTSEGILTVACITRTVAALLDDCFKAVSGVTLARGQPFAPGPDSAFRDALRGAVQRLESADAAARRRLSHASTAGEQVEALDRLRAAYAGAARSLRPLVPPSVDWPRRVLSALGRTGAAYAAFERSIEGAGGRYGRARDRVIERRAELRRLLDRVLSPVS